MPIEESGNMVILTAAISKIEGNAENASHHGFFQVWIINEEQRGGRIGQIDCIDTTITVILFREPHQVTFFVCEKFMGGNHLTICSRQICFNSPRNGDEMGKNGK